MRGGYLNGFFSSMSFVGVILLLISSRAIIIAVATGLIFSSTVLSIHQCHLHGQPPILILELSDHLMQPFYSWRVKNIACLVFVVLLMVVIMPIILIMRVMLVITNITSIIDHICTLAPCVDHLILRGGYSWSHSGRQWSNLFLRAFDDVHSTELFVCSFGRGTFDSLSESPFIFDFVCLFP